MKIQELFHDVSFQPLNVGVDEVDDLEISSIEFDSRKVKPGALFVCVKGFAADGHDYAQKAVDAGAVALCVEHEVPGVAVPQIKVSDSRHALALLAQHFYGNPSSKMTVVGITGTNGKTTTSYLLDSIMRHAGKKTGIIGTVETRIGEEKIDASRTTPESAELQKLLARMVEAGVDHVSMEVSSHAIDLSRVDGVDFSAVAFTNLTQDHLDYHRSMENYFAAKKRLFTDYHARVRVIDINTEVGVKLASELSADYDILTVGTVSQAMVRAEDIEPQPHGTNFSLVTPTGAAPVTLPLPGSYNVDNALVAAGCAYGLGIDVAIIAQALSEAPQVPGRLERILEGQPFEVVVDYAHTPDSLEKALKAMRAVAHGKLIVVFGCGGDRDPGKRPIMGKVAGTFSDLAIATSDNPRTEDTIAILLQVEDGLRASQGTFTTEIDRRHAIERACVLAKPGDCVLIAGKGHEDYQIFAHHTIHFDDREVARESLRKLGYFRDGE